MVASRMWTVRELNDFGLIHAQLPRQRVKSTLLHRGFEPMHLGTRYSNALQIVENHHCDYECQLRERENYCWVPVRVELWVENFLV
jgi:hypothetical protein